MVRGILLVIILLCIVESCALALLAPRAFTERRYRPCDTLEIPEGKNVGKFCHRYCLKYKFLRADVSENCVKWETDIKDFTKVEDFEAFRAAGFVLGKERE